MKTITIAIDGHSSTGKSTLAKQLAKYLGYVYVDTGAMYRAVTLFAMQNHIISENHFDIDLLKKKLNEINLKFVFNPHLGFAEIYLNNVNVENEIRKIQVSNFVSKIAEISEVRSKLVQQQKEFGENKAVVMDGRDIGTVVFPDAELKLFMTASSQIRAERRFNELSEKDDLVTFDQVLKNVVERDAIDSNRKDSPLTIAKDAVKIDNSFMSREAQFEKVLELVNNIVKN